MGHRHPGRRRRRRPRRRDAAKFFFFFFFSVAEELRPGLPRRVLLLLPFSVATPTVPPSLSSFPSFYFLSIKYCRSHSLALPFLRSCTTERADEPKALIGAPRR